MAETDEAPIPDAPAKKGSIPALALSLFLPGLGHGVQGRGRRGAIWLAALVGLWLVTGLVAAFWLGALLVGSLLSFVWYVGCAWDAYRLPRMPHQLRGWGELLTGIVVAWLVGPVILSVMIRVLALESFKVSGGSMCPTLMVQDLVFVDKTAYRSGNPARGDVVVYESIAPGGAKIDFLHRIVAVGGDEIEVDKLHHVRVNGETTKLTKTGELACSGDVYQEELGNSHRIAIDPIPEGIPARLRVPNGHVFLLGDNRANAADSRVSGSVPVSSIQGRVWKIWLRSGKAAWQSVD